MIYRPVLAWTEEEDSKNFFVAEHSRKDWWTLMEGGALANWPTAFVSVSGGESAKLGDYIHCVSLWYFSRRVREAFEEAGVTGVEWHPVGVRGAGGGVTTEFYYLHVTTVAPVLDVKRSIVRYFSHKARHDQRGKISSVREPCIFEDEVPPVDFFRVEQHTILTLVSEKVKTVCERNQWGFWKFLPVGMSRQTIQ